jgi:nicotinamide-nucleotide amidase
METETPLIIISKAKELNELLIKNKGTVVSAESCTGGWIAQMITSIPGSSEVFEGGWVTYSNATKERWLGVDAQLLANYGAVSSETAIAMAEAALNRSDATYSIATTGIAGPAGGSPEKPVGTVWFAWAERGRPAFSQHQVFSGDREAIRAQAVLFALEGLIKFIRDQNE